MLRLGCSVGAKDPKNQGQFYSWTSLPDLPPNQLIEAENKLLLIQSYVASERSRAGALPGSQPTTPREREREKKARENQECLHSTVAGISRLGLSEWCNSDKLSHRKTRLQSLFAESLLAYIKDGSRDLKPMTGTGKEKGRSRNETMLRLVYEEFGLANALLLIYSFPVHKLEKFSIEDCVDLVRCFVREWRYLYCGALETVAAEFLSKSHLKTKSAPPGSVSCLTDEIPTSAVSEPDTENVSQFVCAESTTDECADTQIPATITNSSSFPIEFLARRNETPSVGDSLCNETSLSPIQPSQTPSLKRKWISDSHIENGDNTTGGGLIYPVAQSGSVSLSAVRAVSETNICLKNSSHNFQAFQLPGVHPEEPEVPSLPPLCSSLEISYLAEDVKELLAIIWLAGGCLPRRFFERANHNLVWGPKGDAIYPGFGVPNDYNRIIDILANERLVVILPRNGLEALLMTHPEVPTFFANHTQAQIEKWKYLAAKAIIHAYPKDPQLLPIEYTEMGASLIPTLIRALSYMHELRRSMLERPFLELSVDACLSASNFGDRSWKMIAVTSAEKIANLLTCTDISARVQLRKASLARLYKIESALNLQNIQIPKLNNRSNADFGKFILLQARLQIQERVPTQTIIRTLDQFHTTSPESELEKSVQLDINFQRAKLHRYDGKFGLAIQILAGFMEAVTYRAQNMITIHYYETLCEFGNSAKSIQALEYEYDELLGKENGQSGSARRLKLALGGCYLMRVLRDRSSCRELLEKAETLFHSIEWLPERSLVTKHNYYASKASLGMIYLLRSQWHRSIDYWDEAMEAAQDCFPENGHAQMLIQYAQSEVLYRMGRHQEATAKHRAAQELFAGCGREYYFLGQGTAWLDTLDVLATESGRHAIARVGDE